MSKPFDATLKELIRAYPADWLARVGEPVGAEVPEVLPTDLSAVTAAADTLIRLGGRVIHIEIESGPDDALARRVLRYNVLAHHHTGLPVRSVVVLLRPKASAPGLTNKVEYEGLRFEFGLVKMWELPAADLFHGGIGLTPVALLAKPEAGMTRAEFLPEIVRRIADRAEREGADAGQLLTMTYILAGLHHEPAVVRAAFKKVLTMRESSTYLAILEEGAVEFGHKLILKMGRAKFGEPTAAQESRLKAIQDPDRLDRIGVKVLTARTWDGLLRVQ